MNISQEIRLLGICAILAATKTAAHGAELTTNQIASSRPVATNSLKAFQTSITPSNHELMGLVSLSQVSQLALDEPFKMYVISIEHLTNYSTNQSFSSLLSPVEKLIYPFNVSTGAVASSILRLQSGKWKIASLAQPRLIRNLDRIRKSLIQDAKQAGTPIPSVFAVEVPIVSMWMAGYYDPSHNAVLYAWVHILSPATPHSDHKVSVEEMQKLANEAKAYSGLSN